MKLPDDDRLYDEVLNLSINKSLDDVVTTLQWASETDEARSKLSHIEHAIELLKDVRANLEDLLKRR